MVARGSANSKSSLACFFLAVEVLRELDAMPLTVALMVEGEEELGSPNLAAAVRERAGDLTAEGAFDLDLTAGLDGQPELITGRRVRAHSGGDPGDNDPGVIHYFKWDKEKQAFSKFNVAVDGPGIGLQINVADLDGNGWKDVICAGKSGTHILWNEGK